MMTSLSGKGVSRRGDNLLMDFFPVPIGQKEMKLFDQIRRFYGMKEYKSALHAIDKILKKKEDNKETLSLKGLTLIRMGRSKSEAYQYVCDSIKEDTHNFSRISLGLLYQSDFDYEKAIECFLKALEHDQINIELLHYLSLLQAQMRDVSAFVESRTLILTLEPNKYFNYIASAASHHLNSNCLKAIEVLEDYEKLLINGYPSEHGEMLLYKISLLEESGNFEKALEELHDKKSNIVENVASKEQKVSLLVKLNKLDDAKEIYMGLLSQNPENYSYYAGLQKCVASSDNGEYSSSDIQKLKDLYKSLGEQHSYPLLLRMPLDFLQRDEFRKALDIYIRHLLHERVPSLFSDICPLYEHHDKVDIIHQVILELESSIREMNEPIPMQLLVLLAQHYDKCGQYGPALAKVDEAIEQNLAVAELYMVKHYDKCGQYGPALAKVDEAIEQNLAVAELYMVKGKILKHAGDLETAASLTKKARDMDPKKCRFTNKKYVTLMLQVDKDEVIEKDGKDQQDPFRDMECMWYELASGESYFRQGDLGHSLKNYLAVVKYYTEMIGDHFDFCSYQSSKMTLHAYVETLRYQKRLDPGSYFRKAAAGVVRCYLKLYDSSSKLLPSQKKMQETTASGVSDFEQLRIKKSRKNPAKAHAKELGDKNKEQTSASRASKSVVGAKLLQVENPLLEATNYLKLLRNSFPDSFETYFLLFELSMRKQEIVKAYEALNELTRLEGDNPDVFRCLIRFYGRLDSAASLEEPVRDALATPLRNLHEDSLTKSIETFLLRHKDSLAHTAAAAEMMFFLQPHRKSAIIKLVKLALEFPPDIKKLWRMKDCITIHDLLKTIDATTSIWEEECRKLFPFSRYFTKSIGDTSSSRTRERNIWTFDTGSCLHITKDASLLSIRFNRPGTFIVPSGNIVSYSEVGPSYIQCGDGIFDLLGVCLTPYAGNIVSVQRFTAEQPRVQNLVQFFQDGFLIRDMRYIELVPPQYILAKGPEGNRKYMFMSKWQLDSGANTHRTSDESLLGKVDDCSKITFRGVDGSENSATRVGSCEFTCSTENGVISTFKLNEVYVTSGPTLLSVSVFARDNGCSLLFSPHHYYILNAKDDRLLAPELIRGYGIERNGLYYSC